MPVNEIIAEITPEPTTRKDKSPQNDGRPDTEQKETSFRTGYMMPPYVHNQTMGNRSLITLVSAVLTVLGMIRRVM